MIDKSQAKMVSALIVFAVATSLLANVLGGFFSIDRFGNFVQISVALMLFIICIPIALGGTILVNQTLQIKLKYVLVIIFLLLLSSTVIAIAFPDFNIEITFSTSNNKSRQAYLPLPPREGVTPPPPEIPMMNLTPLTEKMFFEGRYYQIFDERLTWDQARYQAKRLGGDLAIIRNQLAQEFLNDLVEQGDYWIGGFRVSDYGENQFAWVTGEPMIFTNWHPSEPNNMGGNENYIVVDLATGQWNDLPGYRTTGFIVEFPPTATP